MSDSILRLFSLLQASLNSIFLAVRGLIRLLL
jgi:hypothetical protein